MEKEKKEEKPYFEAMKSFLFCFLIIGGFYGASQAYDYLANLGKYNEMVCFQSFPNYCEFEVLDRRENGSSFLRPVTPGYMLHVNQPPYSDRRMPLFNFFMFENFTVRYCHAGLAWLAVPCDEPHVLEVNLRAKNESVYWWEKYVQPDTTGRYPVNQDEEGYTYLY